MESNGKRVTLDGVYTPYPTGEINFGEPGKLPMTRKYELVHYLCFKCNQCDSNMV